MQHLSNNYSIPDLLCQLILKKNYFLSAEMELKLGPQHVDVSDSRNSVLELQRSCSRPETVSFNWTNEQPSSGSSGLTDEFNTETDNEQNGGLERILCTYSTPVKICKDINELSHLHVCFLFEKYHPWRVFPKGVRQAEDTQVSSKGELSETLPRRTFFLSFRGII